MLSQSSDPETTTAGYFLAKRTQEDLIAASGIPYSIVYATEFFDLIKGIADAATDDGTVRVPRRSRSSPWRRRCRLDARPDRRRGALNGIVEIGGPEYFRFDEPCAACSRP